MIDKATNVFGMDTTLKDFVLVWDTEFGGRLVMAPSGHETIGELVR